MHARHVINLYPGRRYPMRRKEALQLVSSLLDPATPMDEKQLAAARLSELIRILLPEEEKEEEK